MCAIALLQSGLFFYDVFWVFLSKPLIGSNVMVTVAKNFKGVCCCNSISRGHPPRLFICIMI